MEDKEYKEGTVPISPFDGGINADDPPDAIQDNQLARGSINYSCEKGGVAVRRKGNTIYAILLNRTNIVEPGWAGP